MNIVIAHPVADIMTVKGVVTGKTYTFTKTNVVSVDVEDAPTILARTIKKRSKCGCQGGKGIENEKIFIFKEEE